MFIRNKKYLLILLFLFLLIYSWSLIKVYYMINMNINNTYTYYIGIIFILLSIIILPIILIIKENKVEKYYIILISIILINIFNTNNLLSFYIWFEVLLVPLLIILLIYGSRYKRLDAFNKLFLYTFFGSLCLLLSILIIYNNIYSLNNNMIYLYLTEHINIIWLLIIIPLIIKVPCFPFHSWLPLVHNEASTSGSVILAAIILKVSTFGIYQYNILYINWYNYWSIIILITLISIIYSSIAILSVFDIKQIIAYSSIIHMSYTLLGIFNNGKVGTMMANIGHGIISSLLFILIGFLYKRYKTKNIYYYRSLINVLPIFSICLFISVLSNIGIPLTIGFLPELLLILNYLNNNMIFIIIPLLGLFINTLYNIVLINKLIFSKLSTHIYKYKDLTIIEFYSILPLLLLNIIVGVYPNLLFNIILLI